VEVSETATTAATTAAVAVFSPEDHKALAKISDAEDKLQDRRAKFKMDPSAYDTNYLLKYPKDELVSIICMYESKTQRLQLRIKELEEQIRYFKSPITAKFNSSINKTAAAFYSDGHVVKNSKKEGRNEPSKEKAKGV
jgi:hypothetical protein